MNTFGLFNSPASDKTLRVLNGTAELIDMELLLKGSRISTPSDVWVVASTAKGTPATEAVLGSEWISRGSGRSYYKLTYGLPDDYDIITDHRAYKAADMSVKDICKAAGLTQKALADRFSIPIRTVEDWCRGVSKCPLYTRLMMAECLGLYGR